MDVRWRVWVGFFGLCLLSGSEWLLGEVWTNPFSPVTQLACGFGLLALLLGTLAVLRGRHPVRLRPYLKVAGWGAVLFSLRTVVTQLARGHVESLTIILLFTLAPAVVVFVSAQRSAGFGAGEGPLGRLLPSLAGLGGAALLLPWVTPASVAGWFWLTLLLLSVVLVSVAALELHGALRQVELLPAMAWIAGAAALVSVVAMPFVGGAPPVALARADFAWELLSVVGLMLPTLLLTVWLLRAMEPVAFSSRYLLVPLLTIVEGYLVLRPEVTWTTPAGLALMAISVGLLVRAQIASV